MGIDVDVTMKNCGLTWVKRIKCIRGSHAHIIDEVNDELKDGWSLIHIQAVEHNKFMFVLGRGIDVR